MCPGHLGSSHQSHQSHPARELNYREPGIPCQVPRLVKRVSASSYQVQIWSGRLQPPAPGPVPQAREGRRSVGPTTPPRRGAKPEGGSTLYIGPSVAVPFACRSRSLALSFFSPSLLSFSTSPIHPILPTPNHHHRRRRATAGWTTRKAPPNGRPTI
jgi:hypothetical protein